MILLTIKFTFFNLSYPNLYIIIILITTIIPIICISTIVSFISYPSALGSHTTNSATLSANSGLWCKIPTHVRTCKCVSVSVGVSVGVDVDVNVNVNVGVSVGVGVGRLCVRTYVTSINNETFSTHKIKSTGHVSVCLCACYGENTSVTLSTISFYKYNHTLNKHSK